MSHWHNILMNRCVGNAGGNGRNELVGDVSAYLHLYQVIPCCFLSLKLHCLFHVVFDRTCKVSKSADAKQANKQKTFAA